MKEITTVWIQSNKEAYRADVKNSIYEKEYAKNYISDIAFDKERAKLQPFEFSVDISTMETAAQGNAGRCWIVAGLNLLREHIVKGLRKRTPQSTNFQLSFAYLCFWDKLEKANCFLEKAIQYRNESYDKREVYSWFQYAVTDDGFWTNFKELVKKYGIVPAEIMTETFQSSNTEEMNNRLNHYLRKISAEIRKAALEGQNIENIVEIKEQALKKIFTFLCRCYGCPPDTFTYTLEDEKQKKQDMPKEFDIRLKHIGFTYPMSKKEALSDISLTLYQGQTVALVGENGSGKTTLCRVLMGLYQPDKGEIFYGDHLLSTLELMNISAVFQKYCRYKMTVSENIQLGEFWKKTDEKELKGICKDVGIHLEQEHFTNGIYTMLGREFDGIELSGGQWQRIAIARGLFKNSNMIILDEPTAAIDPLEETRLYQDFAKICKNKTAVIVTHRLASARIADRVIVMKEGKVIQDGSHEQLISVEGEYKKMYEEQKKWYVNDRNI